MANAWSSIERKTNSHIGGTAPTRWRRPEAASIGEWMRRAGVRW